MTPTRTSYTEERPWGSFERFTENEPSTVKVITVKAGEAFSLQTHAKRDEWWKIISGDGVVRVGAADRPVVSGEEHFIARGTPHRITAGGAPVVFLEISFGDFDENDIERLEDRYGRA